MITHLLLALVLVGLPHLLLGYLLGVRAEIKRQLREGRGK